MSCPNCNTEPADDYFSILSYTFCSRKCLLRFFTSDQLFQIYLIYNHKLTCKLPSKI